MAEAARDLLARHPDPSALPLWGMPYVVGSNVDVVGLPTSIGVPALDFQPDFDADVVMRLQAAGALLVGKVPVDPLGLEVPAVGAAASVAAGLAAFGIASDLGAAAAAARHRVVAIEPTRGLISTEGLFAIAPELDGIAIFAVDIPGGTTVRCIIENASEIDGRLARPPLSLGILDNGRTAPAYDVADRLGLAAVSAADAPFAELATLMDDDVWLALRLDDIAAIFTELPGLFPHHLRGRLARVFGGSVSAQVHAQRRLSNLCQTIEAIFSGFDLLFVPPRTNLTGFTRACGLAAIILPDGGALVGPGGKDDQLDALARAFATPNQTTFTRPIDILASSPLAHR
ncbi:amidase family protein [Pleomorphomonas oryzae]|uniref:amidase family protein n=1 Tax=Pleomorphomonas oryzae TaxID=261934 RepID=UPI001FDF2265|nr:amidase family protein [Pleomorphomonas oryzae]